MMLIFRVMSMLLAMIFSKVWSEKCAERSFAIYELEFKTLTPGQKNILKQHPELQHSFTWSNLIGKCLI